MNLPTVDLKQILLFKYSIADLHWSILQKSFIFQRICKKNKKSIELNVYTFKLINYLD